MYKQKEINEYSHYTKDEANRLATEYSYIIGRSYFPFGNGGREGKEFTINSLEALEDYYTYEIRLLKKMQPDEYKKSKAWIVNVELVAGEESLKEEIEEVLKNLKRLK
jgi:hypothetical protein